VEETSEPEALLRAAAAPGKASEHHPPRACSRIPDSSDQARIVCLVTDSSALQVDSVVRLIWHVRVAVSKAGELEKSTTRILVSSSGTHWHWHSQWQITGCCRVVRSSRFVDTDPAFINCRLVPVSLFVIRHEASILGAAGGPLGQFGESSCGYVAVFVLYLKGSSGCSCAVEEVASRSDSGSLRIGDPLMYKLAACSTGTSDSHSLWFSATFKSLWLALLRLSCIISKYSESSVARFK
jgi:hypothetical protein